MWVRSLLFAVAPLASLWGSGCVAGPIALRTSRVHYNKAIQQTTNEQLLLNLVRLKFREAPLFLEVASVSTQFTFRHEADVAGTINEGPNPLNPDRLDVGAGVGYEEKPTVTLMPLQGRDFVNQLASPLALDVIVLLSRAGWSIDRVLRLTVQSMNGLDNASSASGPTPDLAPRYETFARTTRALRALQQRGLLQIGYEASDVTIPLPNRPLRLRDALEALGEGYALRIDEQGTRVTLAGASRTLVWRVPEAAKGAAELDEAVRLLQLEPDASRYEFGRSVGGQTDVGLEGSRISIATRSLMETLFYLAQAVEVPDVHRRQGRVTTTRTSEGAPFDWQRVTGNLLRIRSAWRRPSNASVAVEHHGHWFYIDDADLSSKSTFALLGQLFALQAGGAESVGPVLTLPVGG